MRHFTNAIHARESARDRADATGKRRRQRVGRGADRLCARRARHERDRPSQAAESVSPVSRDRARESGEQRMTIEAPRVVMLAYDTPLGQAEYIGGSGLAGEPQYTLGRRVL